MTYFGFTPVELGVVAFATGSAALGLYVAALAYRGMVRYDSGPMWYLSVGLFVLTGVTYGTAFVGTVLIRLRVLPLPAQDPFRLVVRVLQFVGLAFIAYSLHSRE
jgi:NO-binding membrane sensor protein with MHYT domain